MKQELNREYPELDDPKLFEKMQGLTVTQMSENKLRRAQHAKATGCVTGKFEIASNIPPHLQFGVFKEPGKIFEAYVRFSNSDSTFKKDSKKTGRGLAIKLLDVNQHGSRAVPEDGDNTQDFLMVNHPVFPFANPQEYTKFMAVTKIVGLNNSIPKVGLLAAVTYLRFKNRKGFDAIMAISHKEVANPLSIKYWSGSPYWLGDAARESGHAVKYSALPRRTGNVGLPKDLSYDYLTRALDTDLSGHEASFDFCVQLQTDAVKMPVEDTSVEWNESVSPPITMATLTIPSGQNVDPQKFESMSFTPWHALAEHRPMGGINRLRKGVYEKSVRGREVHQAVPTAASAAADGGVR